MTRLQPSSSFGLQCFDGPPPLMGHSHRHNDIEVNFMLRGSITYHFGASTMTLHERSFGLFWAAMPHQLVHTEPGSHMYWITLPLALFLKWELPPALAKRVLDGQLVHTRDSALDEPLLRRWQADLALNRADANQIMLLELQARLLRLAIELQAGAETARPAKTGSGASVSKAERMSRYIAEHFHEPLRVEQIAKSVHIHPTYAMHLFRETFGVSIIDYLTQHRIAHAQQLLATTDSSVTEVALESGFNSVSRFYAAFNDVCGKSPRAYRESLRKL